MWLLILLLKYKRNTVQREFWVAVFEYRNSINNETEVFVLFMLLYGIKSLFSNEMISIDS